MNLSPPCGWDQYILYSHQSQNVSSSLMLRHSWHSWAYEFKWTFNCYVCWFQNESGEDSSISPMSLDNWIPDLTAGNRTSVCSNSSEDTIHSPLSRQLSGCKQSQPGTIWRWSEIIRLIDFFFPDVQVLTGRVWTVASARETVWDWRTAPTQGPSAAEPSSTLTSPPALMTWNPSNYRSAF